MRRAVCIAPRRHERNTSKCARGEDLLQGVGTRGNGAGVVVAHLDRPERDADHGDDRRWSRGIYGRLGDRRDVGSRELPHQSSCGGALFTAWPLLGRPRLRPPGLVALPPLASGKAYLSLI